MKHQTKSINRLLFIALALVLWSCRVDPVIPDYTNDSAYPPPEISLSSNNSIEAAEFRKNETVTGNITSENGLRDLYITLLKKQGDEYEEINKNYRVYETFDGFPNKQEFSLEINIAEKETAAIGIFVTDIYKKTTFHRIAIQRIRGIPPVVTIIPAQIETVEFNGAVSISGTAFSETGLQSIAYALVKKSPYKELSEFQEIAIAPTEKEKNFTFDFVVDNESTDAIAVIVTDTEGYKETVFAHILSITGIPQGRALIFENIEMAAEWENPATPSQPYIFSFEGLALNGTLKNVVTLSDITKSTAGSIDFAFVNFWRNKDLVVIANRGLGFASADRITGGTVGRQVDAPWVTTGTNSTFFKLIPPEMAQEMNLDNFFETTTGNWQTYQELDKLSTFVTGTTNGDKQLLQRLNASSDRGGTPVLQIVDGSYIAIRRKFGNNIKYGIIKVVKAVDDTSTLNEANKILGINSEPGKSQYYTAPNLSGFEYTGVTKLYGEKTKLKIIVQQ